MRFFFAGFLLASLFPSFAQAEGTDELMPTISSTGRLGLLRDTEVDIDILDPANEVICIRGLDSGSATTTAELFGPDGAMLATVSTDGSCTAVAVAGEYTIKNILRSFTSTRRWDISACNNTAADCNSESPNRIAGRVHSNRWIFNSTNTQSQERSVQASVYARVPIGSFGFGVLELQIAGVHGLARWELLANARGVDGVNPSRSVRAAGRNVTSSYPIYLSPPDSAVAPYGIPNPQIENVSLSAVVDGEDCKTIEPGKNQGSLTFSVNMPGVYRLICDVTKDGIFDPAGGGDFVRIADATLGNNSLMWDGRDGEGNPAPPGEYECLVELNAGEFHYVAEDIEVAYPGLRMFQVAPDLTRTALNMFWNDGQIIPAAPTPLPNNELPSDASPNMGLSAGPYPDPASANSTVTVGNSRGWGTFSDSGSVPGAKGDMNLMDTWSSLGVVRSDTVTIRILGPDADCDGTGGTDFEEICRLGTDPCACGQDDECMDDNECTADMCLDDGMCSSTPVPVRTPCVAGLCTGDAMCVECIDDDDCPGDDVVCEGNRCRGDDDDMDGIPNGVECPQGIQNCEDTDQDGLLNYLDPDDDDDTILTRDERPNLLDQDTDQDGKPNHLDDDDDDDLILTKDEIADSMTLGDNDVNKDGTENWLDTNADGDELTDILEGRTDNDMDGIPNYLDPTDNNMVTEPPPPVPVDSLGGYAGGGCSVRGGSTTSLWLWSLAALLLWRRRDS